MDYDKFLTKVTRQRGPNELREQAKHIKEEKPNYLLSGGVPNPEIFSFKQATFTLKDGTELKLDGEMMDVAQQYGPTEGFVPLRNLMINFQTKLHNPPAKNWTSVLTSGCQESVSTVMEILLEEGDYVIGGHHIYSGIADVIRPIGVRYLAVDYDDYGMRPRSLRKVLSRWDPKFCLENKNETPKLIYLVPNGGNPESLTIESNRRHEIYKIAQEYNLIIIEDDPYYFTIFDKEIPPSFLSIDVDGRVLRCDSFSKIIAPGFRLGLITGPKPLLTMATYRLQVASQQPSCLSQAVLYKLFSHWGFEGYVKNGEHSRDIFKRQKDCAVKYVKKWLSDLIEWNDPVGGMFLWIKVKGVKTADGICNRAANKKAYFAPGRWFTFDKTDSPYIRVSYSIATEEEFDEGFRILAEAIKEELRIENSIPNGKCH